MTDGMAPEREERGLSARQLVLMFLAGVAVCAVFFAAGFLVGYNERGSRETPSTERVTPSGTIPPTVNPPLQAESPGAEPSATPAPATPQPAKPSPVTEENLGASAPPPAQSQAPPASHPAGALVEPPGKFAVQVAASSTRGDAEKVVKTLKAKGYPAFLVLPDPTDPADKLYRVQVGPYATRDEAEQMKPKLEKEGFTQSFIKH